MAFGGPRSSCVRPDAYSARRLRSLAFLCSSEAWRNSGLTAGDRLLRSIPRKAKYLGLTVREAT